MNKEQLFEQALALNGNDKKYVITVEENKIITRVKWMDATFFSPGSVSNEMREFEYTVEIATNGKYRELDKSVSASKSLNSNGASYNKSIFVGKQISFDKTIGVGKNKQDGETGIINASFNSEEYKAPVRNLLKDFGYKKKMGILGKIFICASVFAIAAIIAAVILNVNLNNKEPVSAKEFESIAKSNGYIVGIDDQLENSYDYIKNVRIAIDKEDDYQVDLYILTDDEYAEKVFENNKAEFEDIVEDEGNSSYRKTSSSKYDRYSATTSESYLYVARIENTVVYANVDIENKKEVQAFIKELGY